MIDATVSASNSAVWGSATPQGLFSSHTQATYVQQVLLFARGGLSADGNQWISCRAGFFLPVGVLSRLFRRLFLEYLLKASDAGKLEFFSSPWNHSGTGLHSWIT
jgi:Putative transposase